MNPFKQVIKKASKDNRTRAKAEKQQFKVEQQKAQQAQSELSSLLEKQLKDLEG